MQRLRGKDCWKQLLIKHTFLNKEHPHTHTPTEDLVIFSTLHTNRRALHLTCQQLKPQTNLVWNTGQEIFLVLLTYPVLGVFFFLTTTSFLHAIKNKSPINENILHYTDRERLYIIATTQAVSFFIFGKIARWLITNTSANPSLLVSYQNNFSK